MKILKMSLIAVLLAHAGIGKGASAETSAPVTNDVLEGLVAQLETLASALMQKYNKPGHSSTIMAKNAKDVYTRAFNGLNSAKSLEEDFTPSMRDRMARNFKELIKCVEYVTKVLNSGKVGHVRINSDEIYRANNALVSAIIGANFEQDLKERLKFLDEKYDREVLQPLREKHDRDVLPPLREETLRFIEEARRVIKDGTYKNTDYPEVLVDQAEELNRRLIKARFSIMHQELLPVREIILEHNYQNANKRAGVKRPRYMNDVMEWQEDRYRQTGIRPDEVEYYS